MKLSRNLNMTTGNPTGLLFTFAIPMLIGNLFQQAYSLADSIVVGHFVGANALAAIGSTSSTTFLFFSVCSGIASGSSVVTSQYFGADNVRKTKSAIANSAYLMFAAALIMGLAAYVAAPSVLRLLGTPDEILPDAIAYIRISCLGVPLVAVYNYASSMLRALGDSRTPLFFLIIASILNIILDVVFVYFFHMGVVGVGVATVIAQLVSGASCILYALRHNPYFMLGKEDWKPDRKVMWHALRLGLPMAMQWSMIAVSTSVLQGFVNSFGPAAMAAYTATCRLDQLLQQPYGSVNAALATYTGQNYGAKRMDRVRDGLKHGLLMCTVFTLVMFVAVQLFGNQIISIFVNDAEVIRIGGAALRITSWFYIFLALIYMCRGVLNGVGDALFSFINGVVEVACRIFLPMLLVLIPTMGVWAIWWTTGATWMISGLTCFVRYLYWRHKAGKKIMQPV
ncbi:MAG: MATE family efflux transporter [Clostridia bacterium]|nr:MATE family efflux transporter [Clostridia bacterium]